MLKGLLTKGPYKIDYNHENAVSSLAEVIQDRIVARPAAAEIVILCIGTDRSTGDSLGPLVGSYMKEKLPNIHLFGTLENPVHAVNLVDTVQDVENRFAAPYILAIDACLGQLSNVGQITLADGPLRPGAGVHKKLPPIGDIHITGIVNVGGFMEYFVLQNTRLHIVVRMAEIIAHAMIAALQDSLCNDPLATECARTNESKVSRLNSFFRSKS